MNKPTLVIGNKNYSSWSLRAWLYLHLNDIGFDEIRLPLDTTEFQSEIAQYSPSGRVPVLLEGDIKIWDSLAIIDYVNRHYSVSVTWPQERKAQATALSIVAEMHAGFPALRANYPMNCRITPFKAPLLGGVEKDIARLDQLWSECLEQSDGPGLFGELSIPDVYFAPVVYRCHSYQLPIAGICRGYVERILALPAMQAWTAAAEQETETVDADEWDHIHPEHRR